MKKQLHILFLIACVATMNSCGIFGIGEEDPTYTDRDLIGTWEAPSQLGYAEEGQKIVFVFLNDSCVIEGDHYGKWGYTYDEGDGSSEDEQQTTYFHGNGWFGWEIKGSNIQTYQTFSSSSSISPYKYIVSKFEGNTMELSENGHTYTLTKVK